MLHDLILALSGHSGDVFVVKEDGSYDVVNDLGFFHPCEVSIISQLLDIGYNFKKISNFCDSYDAVQINKDANNLGGLYLSSLAGALRSAVKAYGISIVSMEKLLLDDPELPLSHLLNILQPQAPLLAALVSLVCQIEEKKLHGCKILEILHRHSALSVCYIKEAFIRIEQTVHSVLYDQLTHWMLYGILLDPHNELFVQATSMAVAPTDGQDPSQGDAITLLDFEAPKVYQEYSLQLDMLPSHIPLHVAEKILFIGEAILVFEREGKRDTGIDFTSVASHIGVVLKNKEKEFLQLLRGLADAPTFSIIEFSKVIENIRHCVSQELCKLVMDANFVTELGDLKAVYLLGRGELYQTLIPTVSPFIKNASSTTSNFNALFQLAGRQVLLEDELLEKFTLVKKPSTSTQSSESHNKGWSNLKIEYNAKWPLHKLFTTKVQDRYNAIFTFLLDIRRAQYRLQQLWIMQMKTKGFHKLDSLPWTLRHQMSLMIDNIQYYLQVDVLESLHWQLIGEIGKTHDYQHLATIHHNFLVSVASQCFQNNKLIFSGLHILLNLVHEFCSVLEEQYSAKVCRGTNVDRQRTKIDYSEKIEKISRFFERDAYNLFFSLSRLSLHQRSQYTSQLIMRIDYNKFYSSNAKRFKSPYDTDKTE